MKRQTPTLDSPFYRDGIGVERCHFCLNLRAVGHRTTCPVADHSSPPVSTKGPNAMRFFDHDKVGVYLDTFTPRVERKGETESKLLDLTLRIQPFTPDLALALDPDVKPLLFTLTDGTPKPKIKSMELKLTFPKQDVDVYLLPDGESNDRAQIAFFDVELGGIRARTEKGVDGYALVFYATVGPLGDHERGLIAEWHTQQRFLTFRHSQSVLNFEKKGEDQVTPAAPRKVGKPNGAEAHA